MQQRVLMLNDRRINGYTIHENSPIGTIILYAGQIAPEGYIPCDGRELSRRLYVDLFNAIGTTYGKGDGLYTFNIPDARDRVPQGASAKHPVGKKLEAGLPNITGEVTSPYASSSHFFTPTGAFEDSGERKAIWYANNNYYGVYNAKFDASKSNAIFGNSETVQAPAFTTNYYIKAKRVKPEAEKTPQKEVVPTEEYIRDLVLKSFPMGELRYFPEKKYCYGYLPADGRIFLPEIYPAFFEYWKKHFEEKCGYDNYGYPRLPDYSGRYIRGAEANEKPFTVEKESLPNIKGTFKVYTDSYISECTGVFSATNSENRGESYAFAGRSPIYSMDAHKGNGTYGRNRNKPSSVIVNNVNSFIYIKVI